MVSNVNLHPYNEEYRFALGAVVECYCGEDTWLKGRDAQPALIGRHYITERDSAPVLLELSWSLTRKVSKALSQFTNLPI